MTRFLIKVTHLEGAHEGKSYLLRKGGYVTDEKNYEWEETTYATRGIAERRCRELKAENDRNRDIERKDEAWNIQRGKQPKKFYIYEYESYEPYEVNI